MATVSTTLNSLQSAIAIQTDVAGQAGAVAVNIQGTFVGTLTFEGSSDGLAWYAVAGYLLSAGGHLGWASSTTTTVGQYLVPVYGFNQIRVRMSAYTSGGAGITMDTAVGALFIPGQLPSFRQAYSASVQAIAPAATPTDTFTILGSATRTIYVTKIITAMRATTLVLRRCKCIHYTGGAYTGGTPAAVTAFAYDSKSPAATAAVNTWGGGLPTVGTGTVGVQYDQNLISYSTTLTTGDVDYQHVFDFTLRPIVLRGTAEYVALNEAGVALVAGEVRDYFVEWEEI